MTIDSDYVRLGITNWLADWTAREWRTAGKAPVKIRIYGTGSTSRRRGSKSPGAGSKDMQDTGRMSWRMPWPTGASMNWRTE
jgi:hypothetical protein